MSFAIKTPDKIEQLNAFVIDLSLSNFSIEERKFIYEQVCAELGTEPKKEHLEILGIIE